MGSGYCFLKTTLLISRRSLTQCMRPSFFGVMNVGDPHSLAPCGDRTNKVVALSPFSLTRDAAQWVGMCKSESKKRLKSGRGSKVVEFSLNENYEH